MSTVEKIIKALKNKIASGELVPGVRINEIKLAEVFQVSRTPVREALLALEVEGFIEIRPRSGMYIKQLSADELREVFEVLSMAEGLCALLAAQRITPEAITELEAIQKAGQRAYLAQNVDKYNNYNQRFHEFLYQQCGNVYLVKQIQTMRKKTGPYRVRHLSHLARMSLSWFEHQHIAEAVINNEPELAQKAAIRHIAMGEQMFKELGVAHPDWFVFSTEDKSCWFEYGYFNKEDLVFPKPVWQ